MNVNNNDVKGLKFIGDDSLSGKYKHERRASVDRDPVTIRYTQI